jgi:hypothetical protein
VETSTIRQSPSSFGILSALSLFRKESTMMKSMDVISDLIRTSKNPFRQIADRPYKPQKHRYERRKVKQYIHSGDWTDDGAKP